MAGRFAGPKSRCEQNRIVTVCGDEPNTDWAVPGVEQLAQRGAAAFEAD